MATVSLMPCQDYRYIQARVKRPGSVLTKTLVADLGVEPSISEVMSLEWYIRSTHPR